jgi:hypothetical protein
LAYYDVTNFPTDPRLEEILDRDCGIKKMEPRREVYADL